MYKTAPDIIAKTENIKKLPFKILKFIIKTTIIKIIQNTVSSNKISHFGFLNIFCVIENISNNIEKQIPAKK